MEWRCAKHPDLALLENPDRRNIVCLTLRQPPREGEEALFALAPFGVHRAEGWLTLLFDEVSAGALERVLAAHGLQAGFSGPFALPASAAGCRRKAELALETGVRLDPGKALYAMDAYIEQALLAAAADALRSQGLTARDFADRRLLDIAQLDRETGAAYTESLWAYLRSGLNPRVAAERVGVHRNTMAYRMERLQKLFSLDFADMNTCFELLFSLWLLRRLDGGETDEPAGAFDAQRAQEALWRVLQSASPTHEGLCFECALLAIDIADLSDEEQTSLILRLAGELDPLGAAVAWDEDMLAVLCAPDYAPRAETLCASAAQPLRCGVAVLQRFDVRRLSHRLRLSRQALRIADGRFVRAQDVASTLFFMAVQRCYPLSFYLHENVIRVMDDDARKGAALSASLYAYLLNFCDMKRAAQQMGVHRNTMEYQMRKIDALIGGAPDEDERFLMVCTYKILALPEAS